MRSEADKEIIESHISDPVRLKNFLTGTEVRELIEIFNNSLNKVHKNTGPITVSIDTVILPAPIMKIIDRLQSIIGECEPFTILYFLVNNSIPHIIHNDDSFEYPVCYKGINIPLEYKKTSNENSYLCFFDQYYLDGPAKFFKGSNGVPTYYNQQIYDYANVKNLSSENISNEVYQKYLSHLNRSWLDGLSINSIIEQVPGDIIIFDTVRLHCSSNFIKQGIQSKLGLSIFTKKI